MIRQKSRTSAKHVADVLLATAATGDAQISSFGTDMMADAPARIDRAIGRRPRGCRARRKSIIFSIKTIYCDKMSAFFSRSASRGSCSFLSPHGLWPHRPVERIKVLKGPQATLYGRNATGGAINIISSGPSFTPRGKGDISFGNYNAFAARASRRFLIVSGSSGIGLATADLAAAHGARVAIAG